METIKRNFSGFETEVTAKYDEKFETLYNDDGELILVSKEMFHHDDPEANLVFDYRYVINAVDIWRKTCGGADSSYISVRLYLVPETKDWNEKSILNAAKMCGWEEYGMEELKEMINAQDALSCGYAVLFGEEEIKYDPAEYGEGFYNILDNQDAVETMDTIASVISAIDSFRGFMIDTPWNLIGTNGWDTLEEVICGGDAIQSSLNRLK